MAADQTPIPTFDPFEVLASGAHPDDIDVVMGGTTIKLAAQGHSVLMEPAWERFDFAVDVPSV